MSEIEATNAEPLASPPESEGLIDGRFKSHEDVLAAYKELEKRYTTDSTPKAPEVPGEEAATTEPTEAAQEPTNDAPDVVDDAHEVLETKGLRDRLPDYEREYAQLGTLSDTSFAELEEAGLSREVVTRYVKGQEALAEVESNRLYAQAGSKEAFNEMIEWATSGGLDPKEHQAFHDALNSRDRTRTGMAIAALRSLHEAAEGKRPRLLAGYTGSSSNGGFQDMDEQKAAQADPRYSLNTAAGNRYRQEVHDKIKRSMGRY